MSKPRKPKGRAVSGWLILDKPVDFGSTEAVSKIKWLLNAQKCGHAGTLDPLASGMLPIALGDATKTVPYVMDGRKVYEFTVTWGEERSTDDLEGDVTASSDKRPAEQDIRDLLPKYTGVIQQIPPQFSAIKIAGERAYDIARSGETVEIAAREIEIGRLDIVSMLDEGHTVFEVECGKGTYVRSLARDMGRDLGCYGHVSDLRRELVEPFEVEDLVTVAELEQAAGIIRTPEGGESRPDPDEVPDAFAALDDLLVDTIVALDALPSVPLGDDAAQKVRLGNPVIVRGRDAPADAADAYATQRGKLIAIGSVEAGMFKPRRVFTA
jgi:tRNA pseudouridine55 synthase